MSISDDNSFTSSPRFISLSLPKLEKYKDKLSPIDKFIAKFNYAPDRLDEHLKTGDSQAAVVLQNYNRLIVAAYTDQLDCVALLEFPIQLVKEQGLEVGDRLLTINTYMKGKKMATDLNNGVSSFARYVNFYPLIADFLSEDSQAIEYEKSLINEHEWDRASDLGHQKLMVKGVIPRDGSPYKSYLIKKY